MIRDALTGHLRPRAPLSQAQPSDSSLPVPPPPRTVAEPRSNPTHLIVPAPPEPRPRPPSAKPVFGREDDSVRRINIPMACAVQDAPFVVVFRQNRISKKYHFLECTTMSSAPDRPAAETTSSYNLSELAVRSSALFALPGEAGRHHPVPRGPLRLHRPFGCEFFSLRQHLRGSRPVLARPAPHHRHRERNRKLPAAAGPRQQYASAFAVIDPHRFVAAEVNPMSAQFEYGGPEESPGFSHAAYYLLPNGSYYQEDPTCPPRGNLTGYWNGTSCSYYDATPPAPSPRATVPPHRKPAPAAAVPAPAKPVPPPTPTPTPVTASDATLTQSVVAPSVTAGSVAQDQPPAPKPASSMASSETWLLTAAVVFTVVSAGRLIVWHAILSHKIREHIERGIAEFTARRDEHIRHAEWNHYAKMPRHRFEAEVGKRNAEIDRFAEWAGRLYDQAERWEASWLYIPWLVNYLRGRADSFVEAGHAAQDELTRIEALWAAIEAARATQQRDSAIANVRYLLGLIGSSSDAAASAALSRLYELRNTIEFFELAPRDLPFAVRAQAAKFLRLAAGTTSLNEARAALSKLRRLFKDNNVAWETA